MSCQKVAIRSLRSRMCTHCVCIYARESIGIFIRHSDVSEADVKAKGYIDQSRQFSRDDSPSLLDLHTFLTKKSIGSLTCPTAEELFLGSCQSDSQKVCGLMVIGGKTRGGEDRSRVSSTSSESLSDGQMTCGCCFWQREPEPFSPPPPLLLWWKSLLASTVERHGIEKKALHNIYHHYHYRLPKPSHARGKDDDAFDQSIFLAGPQISRHLRAF